MNAFYFPSMSRYFPGHKKDKKLIRLRAAAGTKKWILMNKICLSKSLDVADVTIFLKIFNNWHSDLSNDDMISAYSLKTCLQNTFFWSEIVNLAFPSVALEVAREKGLSPLHLQSQGKAPRDPLGTRLWKRVIWRTGRYTFTKNSQGYPPGDKVQRTANWIWRRM